MPVHSRAWKPRMAAITRTISVPDTDAIISYRSAERGAVTRRHQCDHGPRVRLRYVDPRAARGGVLFGALMWFLRTPVAPWLSRHVLWKLDPPLRRLTGGRVGLAGPLPSALLETRGARTGRVRRNAVIYFHDGDRVTIVASKLGAPEHPAWYHNALAHPDVVLGGHRFHVEEIEDEPTRTRLWELADRVFPVYADYRQ